MTAQNKLRAVKTLVRVTLNDSFRIRPRTEVSSLLIVQPAAKIQSPEPRVDYRWILLQRCTRRCLQNAGYLVHSSRQETRIYRWPSGTGRVYRIRTPYVPTIQDCLCFSQIARLGSEHFL